MPQHDQHPEPAAQAPPPGEALLADPGGGGFNWRAADVAALKAICTEKTIAAKRATGNPRAWYIENTDYVELAVDGAPRRLSPQYAGSVVATWYNTHGPLAPDQAPGGDDAPANLGGVDTSGAKQLHPETWHAEAVRESAKRSGLAFLARWGSWAGVGNMPASDQAPTRQEVALVLGFILGATAFPTNPAPTRNGTEG